MTTLTTALPPSCLRLLFIILANAQQGRRPMSYHELRIALKLKSPQFVMATLRRLRSEGFITFIDKSARTIRPTCRMTLYLNTLEEQTDGKDARQDPPKAGSAGPIWPC